MIRENTAINAWLMFPLLVVPALGYGLLDLPHNAAKAMANDGYLAVPAAALMCLPGLAAIYFLARRFPGRTLIQSGMEILGPILGRITGGIYLAYNFFLFAIFMREEINMLAGYILNRTPLLFIIILTAAPTAYFAARGIETISRLASFTLIPAVLVMTILIIAGFQNITPTHLLPINDLHPSGLIRGGYHVLYIFYILGTAAMVLPYLRPLRSFPKIIGGALLLLAIYYSAFTVGTIGLFSGNHMLRYAWPSLEFVHNIDFPYFLLEQAGLLMLIDWITVIFVGFQVLHYIIGLGLAQLTGKLNFRKYIWLVLPLVIVLAMIPGGVQDTKALFTLIAETGWAFYFVYPLFLLLLSLLLRKRGEPR